MRTELFESIHIKNFRSIDDCQLNELSKINFLLGENSVGKTSILEAIIMHANKFNIASILRTLSVSRYVQQKSVIKILVSCLILKGKKILKW